MFEFKNCITVDGVEFPGLYEIQPKIFGDSRGYFFESYSEKDFFEAGLKMRFVQDNQSMSTKGVLRGLHFQTAHPQGKLVRSLQGKVFDVAVDIRNGSPTFGKYHGVILDSEKQNQFYIPEGFAHGFYVLTDTAIFAYKCTDFYDPKGEGGLMWNDPAIGIDWQSPLRELGLPDGEVSPLLSDKDTKHPAFDIKKNYFDLNGKWLNSTIHY